MFVCVCACVRVCVCMCGMYMCVCVHMYVGECIVVCVAFMLWVTCHIHHGDEGGGGGGGGGGHTIHTRYYSDVEWRSKLIGPRA